MGIKQDLTWEKEDMRVSEHWLREWVAPEISSKVLADQLSMAGLEVDAMEPAAPEFTGVLVGEVKTTEPHPNADKLTLCQVDVGEEQLLSIVCGAKNVRQGLKVAVATVGACLPNGFKIKKAKLRGELSMGMLCSESELGLADASNGIMELPAESPVGLCIRQFLNLDDQLIEIDFTPNRGDCLSIRGLAREVAALNDVTSRENIEFTTAENTCGESIGVEVQAPEQCPSYACCLVKDIDNSQSVPLWMKEKLRRANLRSHSLTVDITNYVMMELGQPMHAFDADKIEGKIVVRLANEQETLVLLDGQKVELIPGTLLIADEKKPLAIAGVMGGLDSSVTAETKHIVFESASFTAKYIAGVARNYGLATDSAYRFERGVAPELQSMALERAKELLMRFAGGQSSDTTMVSFHEHIPQAKLIELSISQTNKLLGTNLTAEQIQGYLARLSLMAESVNQDTLSVSVPVFRFDINIEADLIEEVARIFGYNDIPVAPISAHFQAQKYPETQRDIEDIRRQLIGLGYSESINYSFVCPEKQAMIYQPKETKDLLNPLSKELSQMRNGLWVGLLNALSFNLSRQITSQKLFEIGLCFNIENGQLQQQNRIAGVISGFEGEHDWAIDKRRFDFYDLKGDIEQLFGAKLSQITFTKGTHPALHPGKTASVVLAEQTIGYLGELHPNIASQLSISCTPLLFELNVSGLLETDIPKYSSVSKYPSISRDLALLVDESMAFGEISDAIYSIKHDCPLQSLEVFDVYQGDNIAKGKKSLAIGLTLQHPSRTLVDSEVNDYMSAILQVLQENLNITLRD